MISVIIPTYNRINLLTECLGCLSPDNQQLDLSLYEVIVTDDGNDIKIKDIIAEKFPWVKWVEGPKKGPAANRNNGAKFAKSDWLLFTDDDCLPDKNWINEYISQIKFGKTLVYEGFTTTDRPKMRFDEQAPINTTGGLFWSCNIAINKSVFFEFDGFDENFPFAAMEDIDFRVRLTKKYKIIFLTEAVVIHPWRRVKPFRNIKKHILSNIYFLKKNKQPFIRYRLSRIKIFVFYFLRFTNELFHFSFKGWPVYIEFNIINFILIFI